MSEARKVVLQTAISINRIILHAFEEAMEIKKAKEIEKQIIETQKKINNHEEVNND